MYSGIPDGDNRVYSSDSYVGWEECINKIREQIENRDPDACAYCGGELDGEVCDNEKCTVNQEAA